MTIKQERFVIEYVATGNASEAYRRVYDAGSMLPATVTNEAYSLLKNPEISAMVDAEKERVLGVGRVTAAQILARAWEIASSDEKDRVAALNVAAKAFPEFKDATIVDARTLNLSGLTQEQLDSALARLTSGEA